MAYSVCFLSNNTKTFFFDRLGNDLQARGVRIYWIVANRNFSEHLINKYGDEHVLYLPLNICPIGPGFDIKINDLLYADRRLKFIPDVGQQYLVNIQRHIFNFLNDNAMNLLIGEQTYGYECVAFRLAKHFLPDCVGVSPYLSRYPSDHFCYYSDESFSREVYPAIQRYDTPNTGEPIDQGLGNDYKKIIQSHINSRKSLKSKLIKILRLFTQHELDKNDPTWYSNSRADKIKKNSAHYLNSFTYGFVRKVGVDNVKAVVGRKVIYPLHLQPELNIDTAGRYFENQQETIINIWRQLSPDDVLFVKEHPVAIGNRGYGFFKRITRWPNIRVLDHRCNVDALLEECDCVFTVCGTMGLEAALKGKRVLSLAPTTYNRMANVATPTIDDFRSSINIDELFEKCQSLTGGWTIEEFKQHMRMYSHLGDAEGDLLGNPISWEVSNVKLVVNSLMGVLDSRVK